MKKVIFGAASLMGIGLFMGVLLATHWNTLGIESIFGEEKIGAGKAPIVLSENVKAMNDAFANVSNTVLPSVVSISVDVEMSRGNNSYNEQFQEFFRFFGNPRFDGEDENPKDNKYRSRGSGSGVVISENGYIVTNNHVIENAMQDGIKVTLNDKKEYTAKLIGADPLTDLAVLKIDANNLPAVHFVETSNVRIGEWVVAVGNPLGLNSTVTTGIVSAIGRGKLGLGKDSYSVENYIQTDAAINPGNSGGGLFNLQGSLVGINTAIASQTGSYIGYGFAIPTDLVQSVIKDLIDDGKINRGYIGVAINSIRDEVEAKALGLDKVAGVKIENVQPNSAGKAAGLEAGDVILELEGKPVNSSNELQSLVAQHRAGDKIDLTIWRDGKRISKKVTLKAKDADESISENAVTGDEETNSKSPVDFEKLGFTVSPVDDKTKKDLDLSSGAMITKVKQYSPAADRGLYPNGVIYKADRKVVKSPKDLEKILSDKKPGDVLLLQVQYKETSRIIAIEIPKVQG